MFIKIYKESFELKTKKVWIYTHCTVVADPAKYIESDVKRTFAATAQERATDDGKMKGYDKDRTRCVKAGILVRQYCVYLYLPAGL